MIIYNEKLNEKVRHLKERDKLESIIIELERIHKQDEETLSRLRSLKESLAELKRNMPVDTGKKYLAEIIVEEEKKFGTNNMIVAPVGSGKTTLIKDVLMDTEELESTLMLVSNRFLKDSLYESNLKKELENNTEVRIKTTKTIDKKNAVYMMTYYEFGMKIKDSNKFMDNVKQVFCDEIHSLPEYRDYNQGNYGLEHAMKYLFNKQEGKQIFYFTATDNTFNTLKAKRPLLVEDVEIFDYTKHKDIKKYMELSKSYITHIEQIRPFLIDRLESFDYFNSKGLAFARSITSLKAIEEILIDEGYKPLVLWSDANENNELNEEQLIARANLLSSNKIPEGYNFLVMNSALREGWDLNDPNVRLVIMNTTNDTDIIQARGRVRKDVDLIIYRTTDEIEQLNSLELSAEYLNAPLTIEDKVRLCEDLNIEDRSRKPRGWRTIKGILEKSGYEVKDSKKTIDGTRINVSTITIEKGVYGVYKNQ